MATLPSNVIQGATGKKGAAYYSAAANIIAQSAATQSQLLASQSALAMQSMGSFTQSLSDGLTKALDYSLAMKQADFSRAMQVQEFQLKQEDMELKRTQAESLMLDAKQNRISKEMDNAQKLRDAENEPWKRMAMAQLSAAASKIKSSLALDASGVGGDEPRATALALYAKLPGLKEQAIMRGVDPAVIDKLETDLTPAIDRLNSFELENGPMSRGVAHAAVGNLFSRSAMEVIVQFDTNQSLQRDSVVRSGHNVIMELVRTPEHLNGNVDAFIAATGETSAEGIALAKSNFAAAKKLRDVNPIQWDNYQLSVLERAGNMGERDGLMAARSKAQKDATSTTLLSIGLNRPAPAVSLDTLWKGISPSTKTFELPDNYDPQIAGRGMAEGIAAYEYSERPIELGVPTSNKARLAAGTGFTLAGAAIAGLPGAAVGSVLQPLAETAMRSGAAVGRMIHETNATEFRKTQINTANAFVKTAGQYVNAQDNATAMAYLDAWAETIAGSREAVKGNKILESIAVVPSSVLDSLAQIQQSMSRSSYAAEFERWRLAYAPNLLLSGAGSAAPAANYSSVQRTAAPVLQGAKY